MTALPTFIQILRDLRSSSPCIDPAILRGYPLAVMLGAMLP